MSTIIMKNTVPEASLKGLNRRIRTLLTAVAVIAGEIGNNSHEKELLTFYRRTAMAELLYDKYIIAIAGMQGVGKTTLLKQMYEIPEGYLPENIGRGEKLPIMVTEHPIDGIRTVVRQAQFVQGTDDYELTDLQVTPEKFIDAAMRPKEEHMWLELQVPYRYFKDPAVSFALLPGIEDTDEDDGDKEWQEFVHHVLTMASTSIMVFDSTKLAQGQNRELLDTIVRDFRTAKPLLALSFSDERSEADNARLKQLVMEEFDVAEDESDRVILTGTGEEFGTAWTKKLIGAVHRYSAIPKDFRRSQMRHLHQLLVELMAVLGKIKGDLSLYDLQNQLGDDPDYHKQLQVYDEAVASIRKEIERPMRMLIERHQGQAVKEMQDWIRDQGNFKKVKQYFLGRSYGEHLEFTRKIQEAWQNPLMEKGADGDSSMYLGLQCAEAFRQVIDRCLKEFTVLSRKTAEEPNLFLQLLSEAGETGATKSESEHVINPAVIDNLNGFFATAGADDQSSRVILEMETIRLIPVIALERMSEELVLSQMVVRKDGDRMLAERPSGNLADQLKSVRFSPQSIISGVAVVFGLDAVDGTINTIPALLQAFGIEVGVAAMSVAVSLCGLVSLGFVAANVCRQIAKQEFKDEDTAIMLIHQFRETYLQNVMEHLDELTAEARYRLARQIRARLHKDKSFARWEKLRYSLHDVQDYQTDMRKLINGTLGFLG